MYDWKECNPQEQRSSDEFSPLAATIATQAQEILRLRALLTEQHNKSATYICELAARLNKYEPRDGMYLATPQPKEPT